MPDAPATMRFTVLGCGSSPGTPRLNGDWGNCDPQNPRNRRLRASLLVERILPDGAKTCVVIDSGPDFRQQMLNAAVSQLDGVVYTHPHADHIHGIDDLRTFVLWQKRLMDIWADAPTEHRLREAFGYCFETPPGSSYPPILRANRIDHDTPFEVDGPGGPIRFEPLPQQHGSIVSLGFRIGDLAYCSDVSAFPETTLARMRNLDTLIVDALQYRRHPSHMSLEEALEVVDTLKPRMTLADPHAYPARLRDGPPRDTGERRAVLRRHGNRTGDTAMNVPAEPKPGSSMERVRDAADALGLAISLEIMEQSTRTADDAAAACGCAVGQIVKSLVFENAADGALILLLVSGDRNADLGYISETYGITLKRCDGKRVRKETGFAIGGVAPLGHIAPVTTLMDEALLGYETVWAAAGRPDAVFSVDPKALAAAIDPRIVRVVA